MLVCHLCNRDGQTVLHVAVLSGDVTVVCLIAEDLTKNDRSLLTACDRRGNTALHLAAEQNDSMEMMSCLASIDASISNRQGDTPFHVATRSGLQVNVSELLRSLHRPQGEFDVNATNWLSGETALHIAVRRGDTRLIEQLIENGADLSAKNNDGNTALHIIVEIFDEQSVMLDVVLEVCPRQS
jgi:ankyrin repeat protein